MKAISMKSPALNLIAGMSARLAAMRVNYLMIASAATVATWIGALAESDLIMFSGAAVALLAVKPSEKKGGRK